MTTQYEWTIEDDERLRAACDGTRDAYAIAAACGRGVIEVRARVKQLRSAGFKVAVRRADRMETRRPAHTWTMQEDEHLRQLAPVSPTFAILTDAMIAKGHDLSPDQVRGRVDTLCLPMANDSDQKLYEHHCNAHLADLFRVYPNGPPPPTERDFARARARLGRFEVNQVIRAPLPYSPLGSSAAMCAER